MALQVIGIELVENKGAAFVEGPEPEAGRIGTLRVLVHANPAVVSDKGDEIFRGRRLQRTRGQRTVHYEVLNARLLGAMFCHILRVTDDVESVEVDVFKAAGEIPAPFKAPLASENGEASEAELEDTV